MDEATTVRRCEKCRRYARSTEAPWHGRHSLSELRRACGALGVTQPVRVRAAKIGAPHGDDGDLWTDKNWGSWSAPVAPDGDGATHVVTVRWDLPHDVANESLLHELAHAAQYERYGAAVMGNGYDLADAMYGYSANPFEQDACRQAERYAPLFRVAREGGS